MKKAFVFALGLLVANFASAQEPASQISDEQAQYIALHGTIDDMKKLLQSDYNVNKVYQCSTLLIMAVKSAARGKYAQKSPTMALEKVKLLVNAGANINFIPCQGNSMSALHWAVFLPSELKYLEIDANKVIDEQIKNKLGECNFPGVVSKPCGEVTPEEREKIRNAVKTAVQLAYNTFTPHFMEIINFLVINGADVNLRPKGEFNQTPIYLAAINPEEITLEPLKYLIQHGAVINIQDDDGNTPLFWAYGVGNDIIVNLLLNAGADKNIKNKENLFYNEVRGGRVSIDKDGNTIQRTF